MDKYGNEVHPANYDYIHLNYYNDIYNSDTSFLSRNYDGVIKNHIIIVDESKDIDLSDIILQNEITPRI